MNASVINPTNSGGRFNGSISGGRGELGSRDCLLAKQSIFDHQNNDFTLTNYASQTQLFGSMLGRSRTDEAIG
jgi:hypothetical protein